MPMLLSRDDFPKAFTRISQSPLLTMSGSSSYLLLQLPLMNSSKNDSDGLHSTLRIFTWRSEYKPWKLFTKEQFAARRSGRISRCEEFRQESLIDQRNGFTQNDRSIKSQHYLTTTRPDNLSGYSSEDQRQKQGRTQNDTEFWAHWEHIFHAFSHKAAWYARYYAKVTRLSENESFILAGDSSETPPSRSFETSSGAESLSPFWGVIYIFSIKYKIPTSRRISCRLASCETPAA